LSHYPLRVLEWCTV